MERNGRDFMSMLNPRGDLEELAARIQLLRRKLTRYSFLFSLCVVLYAGNVAVLLITDNLLFLPTTVGLAFALAFFGTRYLSVRSELWRLKS